MIGRRINERYKILSRIGDGGMSVVYKAEDLILDRLVAVKVLRSEFSSDEAFIRRFRREAEAVASLSDPNIVNIYDIGEEEDLYYIVMEYVDGMTLKTYIQQFAPIPPRDAIYILKQIASALDHAHQHGLVHRDVKPQNILIDDQDLVKVTDFGIALAVSSATITFTNSIMGSAHYLSPEQAKGGKATAKSDIYAFGIVMYEMLTGRLPFPGESPVTVALKHLNEPYTRPKEINPNIPQSLENIIIHSMTKSPDDRYDGMGEIYHDLTEALNPDRVNEDPLSITGSDDPEATKIIPPLTDQQQSPRDQELESRKKGAYGNQTTKRKGRRKAWLWSIFGVIIVALLVVGAVKLIPKFLFVPNVTVPNVVGKTYDQAVQDLTNQHLYVKETMVENDQKPAGVVVKETPNSGIKVKVNSTVNLFVSKGPAKQQIPNYVGYDRSTVQQLLKGNQFKKVVWHGIASNSPIGQVLSQKPNPNTPIVPSMTVLELTYSTGPKKIKLPDVTGQPQDVATKALQDAGVTVNAQDGGYSDTVQKGYVLKMNPAAGQEVTKNDSVTIYVSKGPKPKPINTTVPINVEVSSNGNGNTSGNGTSSHVVITYTDASHQDAIFKDEQIHQNTTYTLPLTVNPNGSASYKVMVNGNIIQQKTIQYSDLQSSTSQNSTSQSTTSQGSTPQSSTSQSSSSKSTTGN